MIEMTENFKELLLYEQKSSLTDLNSNNIFFYDNRDFRTQFNSNCTIYLDTDIIFCVNDIINEFLSEYIDLLGVIVTSSDNKQRNKINFNKKLRERFIQLIEEREFLAATNIFLSKKHVTDKNETYANFFDNDLAINYLELNKLLSNNQTQHTLLTDIQYYLEMKFLDKIEYTVIKSLSIYIKDEISLRMQKPLVYCDIDIDDELLDAKLSKYNQKLESITKIIKELYINDKDAAFMWDTTDKSLILSLKNIKKL